MKFLFYCFLFSLLSIQIAAQNFTRKDSLRGGLPYERTCFDVMHYGLNLTINVANKSIVGCNAIAFKTISKTTKIQLDLFENMQVDSIVYRHQKLGYSREFNAVFINFPTELNSNNLEMLLFYYSGKPIIAKNAPWDGGFVFSKDNNNKDWIGVACQGIGASLWFPCKDSQSDEPDLGVSIKVAVPNGLIEVSNGRFVGKEDLKNGYTRWDWEVKNPINSYDVTLNIGDYTHFGETYKGLDLDYYVLRDNEAKAKIQFEEVKPMMDCFQLKFGKYPFANDGYKLVETPYLGMEHQSAVAYGNRYKNGYLGNDLSGTNIGLLFDFIIIHESGHEWFGNSITSCDIADMWLHEGFTCYSESVYLECRYGSEKAQIYCNGLKKNILNDVPIIGKYGVGNEGSGDMYYKGALFLNTLRSVINDDSKWWDLLLHYSDTFYHKIINTNDVITYFNEKLDKNLTPIFNQYLKHKAIPILEIRSVLNKNFEFRWKTDELEFEMPFEITIKGKKTRLVGTTIWKKAKLKVANLKMIHIEMDRFLIAVDLK